MKLTKKGLKRLHNEAVRYIENGTICHQPIGYEQMEALSDFEFHPEDFEGVVVLPINEAKNVYSYSAMYVPEGADFCNEGIKALETRIEQVGV